MCCGAYVPLLRIVTIVVDAELLANKPPFFVDHIARDDRCKLGLSKRFWEARVASEHPLRHFTHALPRVATCNQGVLGNGRVQQNGYAMKVCIAPRWGRVNHSEPLDAIDNVHRHRFLDSIKGRRKSSLFKGRPRDRTGAEWIHQRPEGPKPQKISSSKNQCAACAVMTTSTTPWNASSPSTRGLTRHLRSFLRSM